MTCYPIHVKQKEDITEGLTTRKESEKAKTKEYGREVGDVWYRR